MVLYIQHRSALWRGEGESDGAAPCCSLSPFPCIRIGRQSSSVDPPGRSFGLWTMPTVHTPDFRLISGRCRLSGEKNVMCVRSFRIP
uniref:Uncharacterized protein n=1 Tax=Pyxicephalus adspersus TaxID=30357 RepID=A0AAV3A4B7_PYXAD|nr:TPA: hypothetical protein GDO54_017939 [Pyxicephalus adspersus]